MRNTRTVLSLVASRCSYSSCSLPPRVSPFSTSALKCSHVGSLPIPCPPSVTLTTTPPALGDASKSSRLRVEGPKGALAVELMPFVRISPQQHSTDRAAQYSVNVDDPTIKHQRAVWGLTRSSLANAIVGVSTGYTLSLRLVGVGYRAAVETVPASPLSIGAVADTASPIHRLNLKLGYAHPVLINLPRDVTATTPSTTNIVLAGIDKQRLGEVAARVRSWRVPEPYNVSNRNSWTMALL